jgi:hypothetical protein
MNKLSFSDKIILVSTSSIAIFALITSVWQGVEARNHNRLSVKPILTIDRNYNRDITTSVSGEKDTIPMFQFIIKNSGIGPAIVRTFDVYLDDKLIDAKKDKSPWTKLDNELNISQNSWFRKGDVFITSQNQSIIKCNENKELLKRLHIVINYASIYGEESTLTVRLVELWV